MPACVPGVSGPSLYRRISKRRRSRCLAREQTGRQTGSRGIPEAFCSYHPKHGQKKAARRPDYFADMSVIESGTLPGRVPMRGPPLSPHGKRGNGGAGGPEFPEGLFHFLSMKIGTDPAA